MGFAGAALKGSQTLIRLLQLLGSALILGIFSYFLALLNRHNLRTGKWVRAVEGIAGAAVLYTLLTTLLTCFVGGHAAFGTLALVFDLLFLGGFIAVAVMNRGGARACDGFVSTALGDGNADARPPPISNLNSRGGSYRPNYERACRLEKAAFAVAILLIFLFLLSALLQMLLVRNRKKEQRYGPSPANGYTSGSGKKGFFGRKQNAYTRDAELATTTVPTTTTTTTGVLETEKHHHHNGPLPVTTVAPNGAYAPNSIPTEGTTVATWTTPPPRVAY